MKRWEARRIVFGNDLRNGDDVQTLTSDVDRQQPKGADPCPIRMHQPVAVLDSLERMRRKGLVNPLFYFTIHATLILYIRGASTILIP